MTYRTLEEQRRLAAEADTLDPPEEEGPAERRFPGRSTIFGLSAAVLALVVAWAGLSGGGDSAARSLPRQDSPRLERTAVVEPLVDLPAVGPTTYVDMERFQAEAWNDAIAIDTTPNPAALPFRIPVSNTVDLTRAEDCLTAAIYYEAATEGPDGMRAVAQVVLNRVRHPAFPKTVCGVVFQGAELRTGCQFTFTCDGSLGRAPSASGWAAARQVAVAALAGRVYAPVGQATHYHTRWVAPSWAPKLSKVRVIGAHIFYRWRGDWGRPPAFSGRYAGNELDVGTIFGLSDVTFREIAPPGPEGDALLVPISSVSAPPPPPTTPSAPVIELAAADPPPVVPAPRPAAPEPPQETRPTNPLETKRPASRIAAPTRW